jgi:hypothetical protein
MDLSTMQAKLHRYRTFADFEADARLLWDNCHSYNGPNSYYSKVRLAAEDMYHSLNPLIMHSILGRAENGAGVEAVFKCTA